MERISFGGESYIKASSAARELGYTSDYIGQLCRGKKVEARLVGRTWYVHESSLLNHKDTRYRANSVKTKNAVHRLLVESQDKESKGSRSSKNSASKVHYSHDEADLIPKPRTLKARQVETLIEAREIEISDDSEAYVIETPTLPEVRFRGALRVTEDATDEEKLLEKETPQRQEKSPRNIPVYEDSIEVSAITINAGAAHTRGLHKKTSKKISGVRYAAGYFVAAGFALAIVTASFGISSTISTMNGGSVSTVYSLDVHKVVDTISTLKNNVFSF